MELRRPTPDELGLVGELTVAAYDANGYLLGPTDSYAEMLRATELRDQEAELWVAAEGTQLLGTVTFCPNDSPWAQLAGPGEGEFRMLAVAPHARGRGVGDALLNLVERRCAELGYGRIVLSSLPEMTDAHRLYERHGFVRAPERDWDPAPAVHLVAMVCQLTQ